MTITILKAVLVIVILGVMVLMLLGINHIFSGSFDAKSEDADELRRDLEDNVDVISQQNLLSELVKVTARERKGK